MTNARQTQDTKDREIVITRLIDAPTERVWRAWADPNEVVRWWGPHGFTTDTERREFKAGGFWTHTMIGPDGVRYANATKYEEVVENERIVYTNGGGAEEGPGIHFRSTVTFKDRGGRTELTLRVVFDTAAMRELAVMKYGVVDGGNQTLSRLAAHLQGAFVATRLVEAPRERVWKAWTDPVELGKWFGPKGFETFHSQLDLRPGGTYHYGIKGNGIEMWGKWVFREIEKPGKLHFVQSFSDKDGGLGVHPLSPDWPKQTLSTILFQDFGPRTLVTVYWVPFEATEIERKTFRDSLDGMKEGWGGTFDRFDGYLKDNS
ncbi:MAG TPA: SRPBCC family protein [Patescibacteria group bacterium]|nr:SRPBCC family protein [Patescibacteria group bacterium]